MAECFANEEAFMSVEGLVTTPSKCGPKETMDRLASSVAKRGMTVFARIDHAAAAAEVGMTLSPTAVLIFGSPKGGTPLMQARQTMGIDLPLKALVWQDEAGKAWLSYNDPKWIGQRHGADQSADKILNAMATALADIAKEVTA
jgi:uncharacterized protein (DUF302 family)